MKLLVTGAAGFIGSHVVDRLLARGDEVVGVDNFDPFYPRAEKLGNVAGALATGRFELIEADITNADLLERRLGGRSFDAAVHLAARAGVRPSITDPMAYARANVLGTQSVLDVLRRLGVRRFVFASSSSVYGNAARAPFSESDPGVAPISPYAATKRAAELLCQAHQALHGGSVLCLRLFTVYGPRQRPDLAVRKFAALMARGEPIPCYGDGTTERDYTWVGDVVDGIVAAIDRGAGHRAEFEVVNLGSGRPVSLARLVALLGEAMRVSPVVQHLPAQAGDVERTWADITRAARLLGYRPRVGIEEGLGRFVAAWEGKRETRTGKR